MHMICSHIIQDLTTIPEVIDSRKKKNNERSPYFPFAFLNLIQYKVAFSQEISWVGIC